MKLLYFGNVLAQKGKTATKIVTLGMQLSQEGYEVQLSSDKANVAFRLLDMMWTMIRNAKSADHVMIDTYSTLSFYYALVISQMARMFSIPYSPILNGGDLPLRLKRSPGLSSMVFNHAKANIATSGYLYSVFKQSGFDNTIMIPNNIEIDRYQFRFRESVRPKLLWVRSLQELYNPMLAIEVLAILIKNYPEAELCMVGPDKDGSLEKCRRRAQSQNLPVTFTGLLPKEEWTRLAREYDIFMNTTNVDNTPISVIEAMALGLPVVSTNVGGIPYLLDDGEDAILVPPRSPSKFVDAIESLLKQPLTAGRISSNAREKVETFDWKQVKQQWKEVLQ